MDNRSDVHDFLVSRRARLTPSQAGLPTFGERRRVTGLRREEVASLAGMSIDYYARLERGTLGGVSESVLDALARALQLDEAERLHLFEMARAATTPARLSRARRAPAPVRSSVHNILAGMTGTPAYVRNARLDVLAANDLCRAVYGDILAPEVLPMNLAKFVFLDPRAENFFIDWDTIADDMVGVLRLEAGHSPGDRQLSELVGELTTRSDDFSRRWARHNVRIHHTAHKRLMNPVVGEIKLTGEALQLPGDGLTIVAYSAEPGSPAQEQLDFLASWADRTPATLQLSPTETK